MRFPNSALAIGTLCAAVQASLPGADYEALPLNTIFPGPWESNIKAPANKSYIEPVRIYNWEGSVVGAETVLENAEGNGISWVIRPGALVTFEFAENIGGRVCFQVDDIKDDPYVVLAHSESPFFVGREPDATSDEQRDLPLSFGFKHTGVNCVAKGYIRGGFKYLTVYMPETHVPTEEGFWHEGHSAPRRRVEQTWYSRFGQVLLGTKEKNNTKKDPAVVISALWVNCTSFPSSPNGRAYTGYFDSSSSLLNRVWYAGAYTLQLSTIDPREGGAVISFNRMFDHNKAPAGAWYSNYTIANGTTVTTDGAKRDRMVWPGDMTIAVPGIAVSTYDMLAVRNALDTIYDHQYGDGSMPYAGPPMGSMNEFSDTYHLHTLIGTFDYYLYSGDTEWLKTRWDAYVNALEVSIAKVDEFNLLHVSSVADWIRPGLTGHNIEASAILYYVLENSIKLANWLNTTSATKGESWSATRSRLGKGIGTLYCSADNLFSDNKGRRGCKGPEKVLPQDGNSWVLISQAAPSNAHNVSSALRSRWIKYGAPAVEFPNVISPFASSFELLGHIAAGNHDAAVELMELMWGYMLDGPGMTNSTLLEGYRVDGYIHYPAYPSDARNSHAHGWSSGPTTVLMQGILGIELTSPLGASWKIKPELTKWLSYARGGFATKLGKFEVNIERVKTLRTGEKAEILDIRVPKGTDGVIVWGGTEINISVSFGNLGDTFRYWRYVNEDGVRISGKNTEERKVFAWHASDLGEFVRDDTWVKPPVEEWPEGVVDWEVLEEHYGLADQRTRPGMAMSAFESSKKELRR